MDDQLRRAFTNEKELEKFANYAIHKFTPGSPAHLSLMDVSVNIIMTFLTQQYTGSRGKFRSTNQTVSKSTDC